MKRTYVKVLHYAKDIQDDTALGWEETPTEILGCFEGQTNLNIEVKSDAFQMSLYLDTDLSLDLFGIDDKIEVFAKTFDEGEDIGNFDITDEATFNSTILFNGLLNGWKLDVTSNGARILILRGINVAERLLKTFLPAAYKEDGEFNTVPLIIQNLLERVNDVGAAKQIKWDPNNPSVNSRGEAFPTIPLYATVDKPVYQAIRELSDNEYTQDGFYYFYFQSKSDGEYFVWRRREDVSLSGVTLTEGSDFFAPKVEFGIWDVVNYLIINGGVGPNGNSIKSYAVDTISVGEVGMRGEYVTKGDIAESLHRTEQAANPNSFTDNNRFPDFDLGNYTTNYDGTTVTNNTEYNSWFRGTVRQLIKQWGNSVIQRQRFPRYKLDCSSFFGRTDLVPGEIYEVVCPSANWVLGDLTDTRQNLRLVDVSHSFGVDGWNTSFKFEQDFEVFMV